MDNIFSLKISEKKVTFKTTVSEIILNEYRVVGDAHVVDCNRQLSLLAVESVKKWSKKSGSKVSFGVLAENITPEGVQRSEVHILSLLLSIICS
jgi:MOSC domain-containing protein YiiM